MDELKFKIGKQMPASHSPEPEAMPMNATPAQAPWVCPGCNNNVTTAYCPECGERPLDPTHLTIRGLLSQLVHFLTNIDSRVVRSIRAILTAPGYLTMAFQRGQRIPFLGPFKMFILANVLFFAVQSSTELRVYATLLEQQIGQEEGTEIARAMVDRYLAEKGLTLEEFVPIYNQAVSVNARSMIGLMVLPFAFFLMLVTRGSRRPFAVHVVFSLHFYSFLLLIYCIPAAVLAVESFFTDVSTFSGPVDNVWSLLLLVIRATYLFVAINRVYESRGIIRVAQTGALVIAEFLCFLAYRFVLLPITLFTAW